MRRIAPEAAQRAFHPQATNPEPARHKTATAIATNATARR